MSVTEEQDQALRERYEGLRKQGSPLEQLRAHILAHGGVRGIRTIGHTFRRLDQNGDKKLDYAEFCEGLEAEGLTVSADVSRQCFDEIDTSGSGTVNFDEFLVAVRPGLSEARNEVIERAFNKLDKDGSGQITLDDLRGVYSAQYHPKFISGEWTEDQVFAHWLSNFGDIRDGVITKDEFYNYYVGVSASVDDDVYFVDMMKRAWRLDEYADLNQHGADYGEA